MVVENLSRRLHYQKMKLGMSQFVQNQLLQRPGKLLVEINDINFLDYFFSPPWDKILSRMPTPSYRL